ncbi:MAG: YwaF family protein [Emergencia sp.]|nr:YwaF family protein [Emergencia sp.]
MNQFFHHYTMHMPHPAPFEFFSPIHFVGLIFTAIFVTAGLKIFQSRTQTWRDKAERYAAALFLSTEFFYYGWTLVMNPNPAYTEIIPLHLCSIGAFITAAAVFFDNEKLRRFAAVTDILAALIALAYPATVSGIFPNLSYRVCYFFFSHSMLLFMGILQLQRYKRLSFGDMKSNSIMLAVIAVLAFFVNLRFGTDYLFIGMPPTLSFVRIIYEMIPLWLHPVVAVIVLCLIETAAIALLNGLMSLSEKLIGRSVRRNGF